VAVSVRARNSGDDRHRMTQLRVVTNLTCNQNCRYCNRRGVSDADPVFAPAALRARLGRAAAGGTREITFTGGEPTLRADLAPLVAHARSRGVERLILETNATLVDARAAAALRRAGVGLARVNLAGWGPALDDVTRDPGGFARARAGLRALVAAGVDVEIGAAVTRSTRGLLAALPAGLAADLGPSGRLRGLGLLVPAAAGDPAEVLRYEEAVPAILEVAAAARRAGVDAWLQPDAAVPPPCAFAAATAARGWPALFRLTRLEEEPAERERARLPACAGCAARPWCPGVPRAYLDRCGAPAAEPITDDPLRRRLVLCTRTVAEATTRELCSVTQSRAPDGKVIENHIIRVTFACNERCRFCFVSTHLPPPPDDLVRGAIAAALDRGGRVVLSGGEPTLHPRLPDLLELARRGRHPVELQTNAVRLRDPAYARVLVAAGLGSAFVALHGSRPAVADAVAGRRGGFAATTAGLDVLQGLAVELTVNFVLCRENLDDVVAFVRLVAARWPRAALNLSFVAVSADVVPRDPSVLPRYAEALPRLAEAHAEAARLGVRLVGLETLCGLPLCLVPGGPARFAGLADADPEARRAECVAAPACGRCLLAAKCFGLRRSYARLYGTGEVRAVRRLAGGRR
jgi:MoaA/NifB/PqqE/SkfB family radical SAM enzyme